MCEREGGRERDPGAEPTLLLGVLCSFVSIRETGTALCTI